MKKKLLISATALIVSFPTFAGDYLTNTNQNAAFLRMVARGASIDVDGVYSNPAGLAFLPKDGFYLSLTGQSAYQTREITSTTPLWTLGKETSQYYKGTASAPIIPSFHGLYKKGNWTISTSFAITGGGGKASFDNGLPMFNALAIGAITKSSQGKLTPAMYDINTAMDGKQYIYGVQLGLTYKINSWLSAFAGGRMNYVKSGYEGYLTATIKKDIPQLGGTQLIDLALDCDQNGWGITPIIGLDAKVGKWNFAAKYEFITNLNIENKTKTLKAPEEAKPLLKPYADGEQTPHDIPAFLSVAASYSILPTLRASVEYHFFDDKHAGMLNDRQKTLNHGTHEYLAGVEWDINKYLTVSGGFQKTNYGLSDSFQTDTSFYCDSYSLGFGARVNLNKSWSIDAAYFWTNYSDYEKKSTSYNGSQMPGSDLYSRTNKVFGVSLNYQF